MALTRCGSMPYLEAAALIISSNFCFESFLYAGLEGESMEGFLSSIIHLYLLEVGTFVICTTPASSVYWKKSARAVEADAAAMSRDNSIRVFFMGVCLIRAFVL